MYHINRIRYISQKLTYLCRLLVRGGARRSYPQNDRESHNHAKRFINTIHAKRLQPFQIRNREQGNQRNSTYPKCTFHLHRLEIARHKHTQRKREKHTQGTAQKVNPIQRPAHSYVSISGDIKNSKRRQRYAQQHHKHRQCLVGQAANEQRIQDIADILKKQ